MKPFEYGKDNDIGYREILYSIPSWVIAVGLLTIPNTVASTSHSSDGWISILIGGLGAIAFCLINILLAYRFPGQSLLAYGSALLSKPAAFFICMAMAGNFLMWVSYETRAMAEIATMYLFHRTPPEVIALVFLLVVIYAVAGKRAGLFRLHLMFLPIIITIALIVLAMSIRSVETERLLPFWTSSWKQILEGVKVSSFSFVGFEFLLFYIPLMKQPRKPVKLAVIGMGIPVVLYLVFFLVTIAVLGLEVTSNVPFPSIELAKYNEIQVLGMIFERFESVFFVVWIMAIISTAMIGLDVAVVGLQSVFPRMNKRNWIFMLTPFVYVASFVPKDQSELNAFGNFLSYTGLVTGCVIPTILLIVALKKNNNNSSKT
ncbi:endospore germination permease [Paenibacillus allorhizosphaerae]|uniref:Spore germination protein YndE n=1 Tax=Paenibacillus allorhizosphaerae TaxID=2849866 RepID=A0ABM8VBB3_9BACL|nr:endospore germination permease [Paenibacillus allorhizosphaerae]CAG7619151.1 Spore germination protein YndE [Paenibacillus allorhizosphaerae]